MTATRKTFAFLTVDAHGHVGAMLGLADALRARNHRTVFICNDSRVPAHFGHELILLANDDNHDENSEVATASSETHAFLGDEKLNRKWAQMVDSLQLDVGASRANINEPTNELVVRALTHNYSLLVATIRAEIVPRNAQLERVLSELAPDLLLVDQLCAWPAVHKLARAPTNLRWASLCTCNPLPVFWAHRNDDDNGDTNTQIAPPLLGVGSAERAELDIWELRYERALRDSGMHAIMAQLARMAFGDDGVCEALVQQVAKNESHNFVNLYMYPRELDYSTAHSSKSIADRWMQVDALVRAPAACAQDAADALKLLERVQQMRGGGGGGTRKFVYVSLGTTMSCNTQLMECVMRQVFACLDAQPDWTFGVALGARALSEQTRAQLDARCAAPDARLIAAKWWPQPALCAHAEPLIDACVTHGGNNTLCELFAGARAHKRAPPALLVLAGFHDQLDNARRVEELHFGVASSAADWLKASRGGDNNNNDKQSLLLLHNALLRAFELQAEVTAFECEHVRDASFCAARLEALLAAAAATDDLKQLQQQTEETTTTSKESHLL